MTATTDWSHLATGAEVADALCSLYEARGGDAYDEAVTQTEHALQCARLARASAASDALVAAALLHDVGHLLLGAAAHGVRGTTQDLHHEEVGARFLANWFPDSVTEPIALHVAAKRYLCTVDAGYTDSLSAASARSLALQGGPMSTGDAASWIRRRHAADAVALRRWDDTAKEPTMTTSALRSFEPVLATLVVGDPDGAAIRR